MNGKTTHQTIKRQQPHTNRHAATSSQRQERADHQTNSRYKEPPAPRKPLPTELRSLSQRRKLKPFDEVIAESRTAVIIAPTKEPSENKLVVDKDKRLKVKAERRVQEALDNAFLKREDGGTENAWSSDVEVDVTGQTKKRRRKFKATENIDPDKIYADSPEDRRAKKAAANTVQQTLKATDRAVRFGNKAIKKESAPTNAVGADNMAGGGNMAGVSPIMSPMQRRKKK